MPANVRQHYRQELDRAVGNLDWCLEHLRRMAVAYQEHHPEVTEVCELAAIGTITVQELVTALKAMI
jgi:hypothetical protein